MDILQNSPSLFILYLVISSNFLAPTFSCQVQRFINESMGMRHLLGYLTMTFFVILTNQKDPIPLDKMFGISALYYTWFVFTTRMSLYFWIFLILIFATIYILSLYQKDEKDEKKKEQMEKGQMGLVITGGIVTLIGVLFYYGEKRIEYGENFSLGKFILGVQECRGESPNVTLGQSARAALLRNKK
jgi:preprotein translocase subunit YajC